MYEVYSEGAWKRAIQALLEHFDEYEDSLRYEGDRKAFLEKIDPDIRDEVAAAINEHHSRFGR